MTDQREDFFCDNDAKHTNANADNYPDEKDLELSEKELFDPTTVRNTCPRAFSKFRYIFSNLYDVFKTAEFLCENYTSKDICGNTVYSRFTTKGMKVTKSSGFIENIPPERIILKKKQDLHHKNGWYISYSFIKGFFDCISSIKILSEILPQRIFLVVNNTIVYETAYKEEVFTEPIPLFLLEKNPEKDVSMVFEFSYQKPKKIGFSALGWTFSDEFRLDFFEKIYRIPYLVFSETKIMFDCEKLLNYEKIMHLSSNIIFLDEMPIENGSCRSLTNSENFDGFNFGNFEGFVISEISCKYSYTIKMNGVQIFPQKVFFKKFLVTPTTYFHLETLGTKILFRAEFLKHSYIYTGKTIVFGNIVVKNYKTPNETVEILRKL